MSTPTTLPAQSSTPWLAYFKPNPGARLRLFCFPYAGGSAAIYRGWAERLPKEVEVCPVQLPGRDRRIHEPAFMEASALAAACIEALQPYFDKPFALFGHSMGALLSFEIARQLRRLGMAAPSHLFVAGRAAPHLPDLQPPKHGLPDAELIEELRRLNGTPPDILENEELMRLMLPLLRADFAVCETASYAPEPPFEFPITAMGGIHDPDVSCERLEAWREQTNGQFMRRLFPGDHFFLHTAHLHLLQAFYRDLYMLVKRLDGSASARR